MRRPLVRVLHNCRLGRTGHVDLSAFEYCRNVQRLHGPSRSRYRTGRGAPDLTTVAFLWTYVIEAGALPDGPIVGTSLRKRGQMRYRYQFRPLFVVCLAIAVYVGMPLLTCDESSGLVIFVKSLAHLMVAIAGGATVAAWGFAARLPRSTPIRTRATCVVVCAAGAASGVILHCGVGFFHNADVIRLLSTSSTEVRLLLIEPHLHDVGDMLLIGFVFGAIFGWVLGGRIARTSGRSGESVGSEC